MRKQASNLIGKLVVTGQEAVQGSSWQMREDIYKEHISADKVPERLPYAIQTTLVELPGWKRFELNTVVRCAGVTEGSMPSMLRRTFVVVYKAKFMDADYLKKSFPNHEAQGVFPRDPNLKDFLKSAPACITSRTRLWGYSSQYSAADCQQVLEDYVMNGGDEGSPTRWSGRRAACRQRLSRLSRVTWQQRSQRAPLLIHLLVTWRD